MNSLLILNGHKYVTRFFIPVADQAVLNKFSIDLMIPSGSNISEIPNVLFKKIIYFRFKRLSFNLLNFIENILDFIRLNLNNYKVIHIVSSKLVLYFMFSLILRKKEEKKIKIIFHFIGLGRLLGKKSFFGVTARIIFKLLSFLIPKKSFEYKIIYLNKKDGKVLKNIFSKNVFSFHKIEGAGVDLNKFKFIERKISHTARLLFLGRLIPEKGVSFFINICNDLKKIYKIKFKASIVGAFETKKFEKKVKNLIEKNNLTEEIELIGEVVNPQSYYSSSDIFLFPSKYGEGIPTVIIEALATGLPTFASNIPGCSEIFSENSDGNIVKDYKSKNWCKKINELIKNKDLFSSFSSRGRKIVENKFEQEKLAKKTIFVYLT